MDQINGQKNASGDSREQGKSGVFARMYPKDTALSAVDHEDIDIYWDNPEECKGKTQEILEKI